jgi:hypothetical protein
MTGGIMMNRDAATQETYIAIAFALIFVIVRPFLAPSAWDVILAIATWPTFAWCRQLLGAQAETVERAL